MQEITKSTLDALEYYKCLVIEEQTKNTVFRSETAEQHNCYAEIYNALDLIKKIVYESESDSTYRFVGPLGHSFAVLKFCDYEEDDG